MISIARYQIKQLIYFFVILKIKPFSKNMQISFSDEKGTIICK